MIIINLRMIRQTCEGISSRSTTFNTMCGNIQRGFAMNLTPNNLCMPIMTKESSKFAKSFVKNLVSIFSLYFQGNLRVVHFWQLLSCSDQALLKAVQEWESENTISFV